MATISRLLKNIGLFCERALLKRLYFAKETCHFKEPTNRSHPVPATAPTHVRTCVGFRVKGLGFTVKDLGFRVELLGFRECLCMCGWVGGCVRVNAVE